MIELASEKNYTIKEVGGMNDTPVTTIRGVINRLYPDKMVHGKVTYLTEEEITEISKELKKAHNRSQNNLGSIYIAKCQNYYKIGQSKTPLKRIKTLKTANPYEVELIYQSELFENVRTIERKIQNDYSKKCIHGEWFKLTKNDISKIIKETIN